MSEVSKSERIRQLYDEGLTLSQIAEEVGIRYQFVYNVVSRLCNKRGEEVRKAKQITTTSKIKELYSQGKKVSEIARHLNVCDSFVYQVCKKLKEQQKNKNK